MVKFFESTFSYDYQWPAVTLAYFLRYPNPYSTHVVSTDTLDMHIDPISGNLHITRLHLKRGKLPKTVARFIPKIKESYILEKSVVDTRHQTLSTETRNLDWNGVLSVVENQVYTPDPSAKSTSAATHWAPGSVFTSPAATLVKTVVKFESKLGAARRERTEERRGWLGNWTAGMGGVRGTIELVGKSSMKDGIQRSREGMKIVLEQLRERGLVRIVKEQRQGGWERWKKVWRGEGQGVDGGEMI
ncbi:PRELI-like family-domain-containing protein [Pyronema domesticum]|uniref:Similar to Protein UPS1, mitochondrial acc. no. Q05776 n=1 Tax=Pyronema omphalodes (strain CBS 100304) TaxID=1076935 RepID=U4L9J9_PYROM|nr:PRELI-like family-domain-containing protein [Pyronema domesticum]CCX06859.1 Similar to Protein UPS1, mitochondrial; acc. no. Q05776 [Pyronema omphalodes CBS 100304]